MNGFTSIDAEVEFWHRNATNTATQKIAAKGAPGATATAPAEPEAAQEHAPAEATPEDPPVYLMFRFRREPLRKNSGANRSQNAASYDSGSAAAERRRGGGIEMIELLDDQDEDAEDGATVVPKGNEKSEHRRKGEGLQTNGDHREGMNEHGKGTDKGLDGRKRAGSPAGKGDSEEGGGKGRKRPKGRREEKGKEQEEKEGEAVKQEGDKEEEEKEEKNIKVNGCEDGESEAGSNDESEVKWCRLFVVTPFRCFCYLLLL